MHKIPVYMDLPENYNRKKGQLPFFIGISHIAKSTPLHHHDFVELSYIIEGTGCETINGKSQRLQPGVISFLLPHHMHEIRSDPGQTIHKYCCMFDMSLLCSSTFDRDWLKVLYSIGSVYPSFAQLESADAEALHAIFRILMQESAMPHLPGRNNMIQVKLTEAMLLFVRAVCAENQPGVSQPAEKDTKQDFLPILQHLHVYFANKLSLDGIAKQFGISAPYVSRMFKEHTGKSFLSYLHQLRIDSAVHLLVTTDMSIADISAEVGFESFRTFSRVFQSLKQTTPREFQLLQRR
ncbi:AraC family transcriptional regulator [Paenibacillus koleovorans]|uniref:AraC family transcriptional regulator n=1 Tax=Paenibacillus koleovorans TaxID=121608 RepID=UPI000FD79CA0|nr:AraC family transcriptional regulator [Paenibacillus koleovorans]